MLRVPSETVIKCGTGEIVLLRGGSGTPLLVLHDELGWPGWTSWCDRLAESHELIVPLQPGFGRSPRIRWIRSYRDLAMYYARLVRELGIEPVDVLGFSAGGYIAAEMAACSPHTVARLTLVAPMGIKPAAGVIADFLAMPAGQHLARTIARTDSPDAALIYGGKMTVEQFELLEDARAETARLGWEPFMFDPALPHHLGGIGGLPVQLIWGDQDQIVPSSCIDAYAQTVPNARVDVLPGAGHRPEVEFPHEFVEVARAFLDVRSPSVAAAGLSHAVPRRPGWQRSSG
jgi:pimeloyl-ACP methyl ester carboxylesterase